MLKFGLKLHNYFAWWALAAMLIWLTSAITHPMMSWFGPKAAAFFPPSLKTENQSLGVLNTLLTERTVFNGASVVKVVPSSDGPVLQISKSNETEREYYSLKTGKELPQFDKHQAIFLAEHYTKLPENQIKSVDLITEFSDEYPSVNRLLPVYKINYKDAENLSVYIHTETQALAGIVNDYKRTMQWVFQNLHTMKWMNDLEIARVIMIGFFMTILFGFAVTGLILVLGLKNRKMADNNRQKHRLLGYILWLPLLTWSVSGLYHLIQHAAITPISGIRLSQLNIPQEPLSSDFSWLSSLNGKHIRSISMVNNPEGMLLYRVSATEASNKEVSRKQKYRGQATEKSVIYINAHEGTVAKGITDKTQILSLASQHYSQVPMNQKPKLVTRFGPNYDFRNKRLPVWQLSLEDEYNTIAFIDPITGILVDQSRKIDRLERFSFSFLHKWSHLTPFIGRQKRDMLIVATLLLIGLSSFFGTVMLVRKKSKRK